MPTVTSPTKRSPEKPLDPISRLALLSGTLAVIALVYLSCILELLWIAGVLGFYIVGMIAGRGLAGALSKPMGALGKLATLIFRSMRLTPATEWTVQLPRANAHRLYAVISEIAHRVGVDRPDNVALQMDHNASVQLRGYRKGRGGCTLYIGYDFLITLTQGELEAIIAHEMAHAKLMNRAFAGIVRRGVARVSQLAEALDALLSDGAKFYTAAAFQWVASRLARASVRLFSACCRQEEFAADAVSAEISGTETTRTALVRTAVIARKGRYLNWRDRLVRAQRDESFTQWLRSELLPREGEDYERLKQEALEADHSSEFDAHPSMSDRIAALPEFSSARNTGGYALDLIDDADAVAERFIADIERIAAEHEREDTEKSHRLLRKKARKSVRKKHATPGQIAGALLITLASFGIIPCTIGAIVDDPEVWLAVIILLPVLILGILLCMRYRYNEHRPLPVPPFAKWQKSREKDERRAEEPSLWKPQLKLEMQSLTPPQDKKARARFWADVCYDALAECDYRRAVVASDYCIEADNKSLEGILAGAIAYAYIRDYDRMNHLAGVAMSLYSLGPSMNWALGWACILVEEWDNGEMYFLGSVRDYPDLTTPLMGLAICQARRGKIHEGITNARKAIAMDPADTWLHATLVKILLYAGHPKEAEEALARIPDLAATDYDLLFCALCIDVLLGRMEQAERKAADLEQMRPGPETLQKLAQAYMDSKCNDHARVYLDRLREMGYYPDALLALARIEYIAGDKDKTREYLLSAIDLTREPGEKAAKPLDVLPAVSSGLLSLDESTHDCTSWVCAIDMSQSPAKIDRLDLLVCTPEPAQAREIANEIYAAMHPGQTLTDDLFAIEKAIPSDQPAGPIQIGIYGSRTA